eukprot:943235-Rhodomonas_salina.1
MAAQSREPRSLPRGLIGKTGGEGRANRERGAGALDAILHALLQQTPPLPAVGGVGDHRTCSRPGWHEREGGRAAARRNDRCDSSVWGALL